MRVLGIVPARGGSKGVPRKNIRLLCGKPLLRYTAEAALEATRLNRVVLTTDDEEIAEVGRQCGLDVPFMRPAELAQDDTPSLPVIQHAVRALEGLGDVYDAVCVLQPTNPMRRARDIDECIRLLDGGDADSVMTMLPVPDIFNPHCVYFRSDDGRLALSTGLDTPLPRRQLFPPAYHREGSVYLVRRNVLIERNSLYGSRTLGHVMEPGSSVNIDTPEDWIAAEAMLSCRQDR